MANLSKFFKEYRNYSQVHHAPTTQNRYRAIIDNFKRYLKKFPFVKKVSQLDSKRHTFASHLVMSGVDLPTVKKLLGHADIETTMIYSHLADEHVDKAVDKLSLF